tara:strand:+ start:362 stop:1069 length:708 start_codon:yes stop_codon:yes gene_type:complete
MTTIEEYYKLKETQENKFRKIRNSIFSQTSSQAERKELLNIKNIRCINCKGRGGLKFYSTYDTLIAECNAVKKCDYKIEIKKNHSKFIPSLKLHEKINHLKGLLIEVKTKNLFRYLNDDETLEKMEAILSKLEETTLIYKKINEEKDKSELRNFEDSLFQIVSELKDKSASEIIEIYNTILKETLEVIRELKYSYIDNHIINSKEGELDILGETFNKVIFATEDITHYILDIKSI